jgi:hypothetical protein
MSSWHSEEVKTNSMGKVEDRFPKERGKSKYRELPIPVAVNEEDE